MESWYTHYQERERAGGTIPSGLQHVLEIARLKLVYGETSDDSRLAAIGIRVGVTFDASTRPARECESRLVERHMRVLMAVPGHREYMWTCAPSEPILAEVAGYVCDMMTDGPGTLARSLGNGLLARGERGEVAGRMLWTAAHDSALGERNPTPSFEGEPFYHVPIKVLDLLKHLFEPCMLDKILQAKPAGNQAGPTLQAAFENSWVFFSHFAFASNEEMLRVDDMYTALVRGMALQGYGTQRSIDTVIPIHRGALTDTISPANTSAINLQFKNRKKVEPVYVDRSITIPNNSVPVLSVVMELGDPRADQIGVDKLVEIQTSSNCPPSVLHEDPQRDFNHYVIVARGHGPGTYRVVSNTTKPLYDEILASGSILQDFPRSGQSENVELLLESKPFFEGGTGSHTSGWIEH